MAWRQGRPSMRPVIEVSSGQGRGLVALAIQYGHLRTAMSGAYASRSRDGIHEDSQGAWMDGLVFRV
ncbi:hypothetical protein [Streptomyces canus]|uniref:hypothetical protein n=1 Tax=Streptomyces canus TaxID=58343 RepID=UPI002DD976DA|nr:hypothetical protein [Streptomyces canus]WSD91775.1 hypothetical protein OG925_49225 [Streptomyces canus]